MFCAVHVAGVLEGKHFGNVTKAQRLFQRALDVDPSSEDAQLGFMQCKALGGDALVQDTEDLAFHRLIYNASNISPPAEAVSSPLVSE
jgi:two-component SAPR family response regulator